MKKVYVVGEAKHYASFITNIKLVDDITTADIVVFTGGEDVDPLLYGATKDPKTFSNLERDLYEKAMFEKITPNQLVIGVCRGSQFLCVMNGGKLIQHVGGHAIFGTHGITNNGGIEYDITSTHHQMQYPYELDNKEYDILYWASNRRSGMYCGDGIDEDMMFEEVEPEIVLYHKDNMPKCLAIQGHPEYMRKEAPVVKMLNNLINNLLKDLK